VIFIALTKRSIRQNRNKGVNVFEALPSKWPYKEAWSFEEAMEIMEEGRGLHFDPLLLDTFLKKGVPVPKS
jgi:response regulator RpfG family c-di-GMP phosphodiesterase